MPGRGQSLRVVQPVSHIDFLPTLLDLLGAPKPGQCAGKSLTPLLHGETMPPENIFIEEGAVLQYCTLNASAGPIYIGRKAEIMEGSLIRGPFALCEGATVKLGAKIYGATTIGPYSIVGGEINLSVGSLASFAGMIVAKKGLARSATLQPDLDLPVSRW